MIKKSYLNKNYLSSILIFVYLLSCRHLANADSKLYNNDDLIQQIAEWSKPITFEQGATFTVDLNFLDSNATENYTTIFRSEEANDLYLDYKLELFDSHGYISEEVLITNNQNSNQNPKKIRALATPHYPYERSSGAFGEQKIHKREINFLKKSFQTHLKKYKPVNKPTLFTEHALTQNQWIASIQEYIDWISQSPQYKNEFVALTRYWNLQKSNSSGPFSSHFFNDASFFEAAKVWSEKHQGEVRSFDLKLNTSAHALSFLFKQLEPEHAAGFLFATAGDYLMNRHLNTDNKDIAIQFTKVLLLKNANLVDQNYINRFIKAIDTGVFPTSLSNIESDILRERYMRLILATEAKEGDLTLCHNMHLYHILRDEFVEFAKD